MEGGREKEAEEMKGEREKELEEGGGDKGSKAAKHMNRDLVLCPCSRRVAQWVSRK